MSNISPFKLIAGACAACLSMLAGSFFGDSGTLIGAATGSVIYGVGAEGFEQFSRKAHGAVKSNWKTHPGIVIGSAAAVAAVSCAGAYTVLTVAEASSGKTLHGLVTNSADYGSSFSHSKTPAPAPSPDLTPSGGVLSPSPSGTPSPTLSPTVVPTLTPTPVITSVPVTTAPDPATT